MAAGPSLGKLALAAVVVIGGGLGLWAMVRSPPAREAPAPAPPVATPADARSSAADALRRAPIAPAIPPVDAEPRIAPPASGGFAAWTGLEGTRPGELEAIAAGQGVPFEVARESRRLLWLVELSRHRPLVAQLSGRAIDDAAWSELVRTGSDALRADAQLLDDLRAGTIDAGAIVPQLRGIEADYRAEFRHRTGLTETQFDELFANRDLGN